MKEENKFASKIVALVVAGCLAVCVIVNIHDLCVVEKQMTALEKHCSLLEEQVKQLQKDTTLYYLTVDGSLMHYCPFIPTPIEEYKTNYILALLLEKYNLKLKRTITKSKESLEVRK